MRNFPKILNTLFLSCILALTLTACNPILPISPVTESQNNPPEPESSVKLDDVLKGNKLLAFSNKTDLFIVDPEYAKPIQIYTFKDGEQPADTNSSRYIISPKKQWVVWYSPEKGVMALNLHSRESVSIHEATAFLNTYPYFEFVPDEDTVAFITNNGNTFERYSLTAQTADTLKIPYPYGNVFKISPNKQFLLFVSGYGQTKEKPEYMLTDGQGSFIKRFSTNTNLSERTFVQWAPDSSGILIIHDNQLLYYPNISNNSPKTVVSFDQKENILSSQLVDSGFFIQTSLGYWHVYSFPDWKEIARTPIVIASELQTPRFIPWAVKQFLIEETIVDGPNTFNRLWASDFRGTKKIVVEKYNELILQTQPQVVD